MDALKALLDLEEIRKLQAIYGHYCDFGWNGKTMDYDKAAALFTEDATWECAETGASAKGRTGIRELFKAMSCTVEYYMHGFINPIIDVDGDTATGKWLLHLGCDINGKTSLLWGIYDIEYVRTSEGWRFKSIKVYLGKYV